MAIELIGAASGAVAQNPASELGPDYLYTHAPELRALWKEIIPLSKENFMNTKEQLLPFFKQLKESVSATLNMHKFPVVIGGDHSCAIASWGAVIEHLKEHESLGLLWLDAHLDSHTFHTTPSQAIHGMPLASLLGYGEDDFIPANPLLPENVAILGARSWENGERELLDFLGVRIFEMPEIQDRGLKTCLHEAVEIISKNTTHFGVSLDLDMFDPEQAPAVCSKAQAGIGIHDFFQALDYSGLFSHPKFTALDIVEFAPSEDQEHQTLDLIQNIVYHLRLNH